MAGARRVLALLCASLAGARAQTEIEVAGTTFSIPNGETELEGCGFGGAANCTVVVDVGWAEGGARPGRRVVASVSGSQLFPVVNAPTYERVSSAGRQGLDVYREEHQRVSSAGRFTATTSVYIYNWRNKFWVVGEMHPGTDSIDVAIDALCQNKDPCQGPAGAKYLALGASETPPRLGWMDAQAYIRSKEGMDTEFSDRLKLIAFCIVALIACSLCTSQLRTLAAAAILQQQLREVANPDRPSPLAEGDAADDEEAGFAGPRSWSASTEEHAAATKLQARHRGNQARAEIQADAAGVSVAGLRHGLLPLLGSLLAVEPADYPVITAALRSARGSILEAFDLAVFGFFAPVIGAEFFPDDDPATSLLQCFCVFWLAFAFKPLGGTVLGLAGEKAELVCAITRFLTTLIMGLLPNSDSMGTAAPALLILARILQGLAIGGQQAIDFDLDSAPSGRQVAFLCLANSGTAVGFFCAAILLTVLQAIFSTEGGEALPEMASFGWRIPFILSAIVALAMLIIQLRSTTTPSDDVDDSAADDEDLFANPLAAESGGETPTPAADAEAGDAPFEGTEEEHAAAVKLQAITRGNQARKQAAGSGADEAEGSAGGAAYFEAFQLYWREILLVRMPAFPCSVSKSVLRSELYGRWRACAALVTALHTCVLARLRLRKRLF